MNIHPGLQMPMALRRCCWCGEAEKPHQKHKKCASCEYVIYCSKECQKAAWPDHKQACRYMTESTRRFDGVYESEVLPFGFSSSLAYSRALGDWTEAHSWALQTCAQAFVLQLGGTSFIKIPSEYIMCYKLNCRTKPGQSAASRNPAMMFSAQTQGVVKIEDWMQMHPNNVLHWQGTASERDLIARSMAERCGSAFACLLTVVFKSDGITSSNTLHFPVLHTRQRLPLDEAAMDLLGDVIMLCYRSIDQGFPLRCLEGSDSTMPLPGHFVRKSGKWVWEPFFDDWDDFSPTSTEYPALCRAVAAFKTKLTPKQLLTALLSF
ncbi:hypothetical protein C8Q73DRAFT_132012 [Cubamyces lactineus]|nr:hypothetical protein C8Q73DRAFT_132012 [Cubamyces lactineus]